MLDTRPLRVGTFRHLAAAYTVNEFGNIVGAIALAIMVFDRTDSALATASLFLALQFVPALVAPLLTVHFETVPARRVLPVVYLLETGIFILLADLAHQFSLLAVLALAAADGALAITAKALTRSASANHLLRRGLLREGNAILNLGAMGANAIGPAIAGGLVTWHGSGTALLVDAATFVLTALIVLATPRIHIESDHEAGAAGRMHTGLKTIAERPALITLFIAFGLALALASIAVPVDVVFVKRTLHAGDAGYGLMQAAWGGGMVVGGALFVVLSRIRVMAVLGTSGALIAAAYAGLTLSPDLATACAFSAIGGIANGVGGIAAVTAVQQAIPLRAQSAVMAVFEALAQVAPAAGFIAGGAITAAYSPRTAYAVVAVGLGGVLAAAATRKLWRNASSRSSGGEVVADHPAAPDRSSGSASHPFRHGVRAPAVTAINARSDGRTEPSPMVAGR